MKITLALLVLLGFLSFALAQDVDNSKPQQTLMFTVLDVTDEGAHVRFDGLNGEDGEDAFISGINVLSDKHYAGIWAIKVAPITYTTVAGSKRRIPAYRKATDDELIAYAKEICPKITYDQYVHNITNRIAIPPEYMVIATRTNGEKLVVSQQDAYRHYSNAVVKAASARLSVTNQTTEIISKP